MSTDRIKIIECPRDAMQGFHHIIPTETKVEYINALLRVGFDVLDCGSFVSPKAVPMLADTKAVLDAIDLDHTNTKLLVIVANERGAEEAATFKQIDFIGYPFSISEQFQKRNTNHGIIDSIEILKNILAIANKAHKEVVVYLSMGFGNPYNEEWSTDLAIDWCKRLADLGIKIISLSDTIGVAKPTDIDAIFKACQSMIPNVELGAHFHTRPDNYLQNISAAYNAGCRRFDSAMRGFGGCPFASDKLTGNLPTEALLSYIRHINEPTQVIPEKFDLAYLLAGKIFI
ncbi:MAG: hydroxymethylglutaryl-CoA lyase [bacterium]|nr:hydroxymethylglutaryl-CoA lyase [bacterium]